MNINSLNQQEQESVAAFAAFWKKWGLLLTSFILAVLLGVGAWSGYDWYKNNQATKAANLYTQILQHAQQPNKIEQLIKSFNELKNQYPNTMQAQQAALLVGRILYEKGKMNEAQEAISFAASNSSNLGLQSAARIQLAGVYIEQKKYNEALAQVSSNIIPSYLALANDRKGDAYAIQNKTKEAIEAYTKAYQAMPEEQTYKQLIALKLSRLGADVNKKTAPDTKAKATKK